MSQDEQLKQLGLIFALFARLNEEGADAVWKIRADMHASKPFEMLAYNTALAFKLNGRAINAITKGKTINPAALTNAQNAVFNPKPAIDLGLAIVYKTEALAVNNPLGRLLLEKSNIASTPYTSIEETKEKLVVYVTNETTKGDLLWTKLKEKLGGQVRVLLTKLVSREDEYMEINAATGLFYSDETDHASRYKVVQNFRAYYKLYLFLMSPQTLPAPRDSYITDIYGDGPVDELVKELAIPIHKFEEKPLVYTLIYVYKSDSDDVINDLVKTGFEKFTDVNEYGRLQLVCCRDTDNSAEFGAFVPIITQESYRLAPKYSFKNINFTFYMLNRKNEYNDKAVASIRDFVEGTNVVVAIPPMPPVTRLTAPAPAAALRGKGGAGTIDICQLRDNDMRPINDALKLTNTWPIRGVGEATGNVLIYVFDHTGRAIDAISMQKLFWELLAARTYQKVQVVCIQQTAKAPKSASIDLDAFKMVKAYSKGPFDYVFEKTFRFDFLSARYFTSGKYKLEVTIDDNKTPESSEALAYNKKAIERIDKFVTDPTDSFLVVV